MTHLNDAENALGELFFIGITGLELDPHQGKLIQDLHIGSVLLFAQNYDSPAQACELTRDIQMLRSQLPLFIAVDQEGGRVQRFKKGMSQIPSAKLIGDHGSSKIAFEISRIMAKELRAVGINVNFAPIADIHTESKNPVIGDRAFGSTPEKVSVMVSAFIRGHILEKVLPCIKHFPGHGDTTLDSHEALPSVATLRDILLERELIPFTKGIKAHCELLMTAHMMVPALDPLNPVTLSSYCLEQLLRTEMRYRGIIISDDMQMKAITDHYGSDDAPVLALNAGCDMLIYRSFDEGITALESVRRALHKGSISPKRILESKHRIQQLKRRILLPYTPPQVEQLHSHLLTPENQQVLAQLEKKRSKKKVN